MRIIDKRKDYYDGAVLFSPDPVWVRKQKSFIIDKTNPYGIDKSVLDDLCETFRDIPAPTIRHHKHSYSSHIRPFAMVGFCGSLYIVYFKSTYLGRPQDIVSAAMPSSFVKKWNENTKDKMDHIKIDDYKKSLRWFRQHFNDKMVEEWYDENGKSYMDLHRKIKSPVFLMVSKGRDIEFVVNPLLVEYGFQTVMDSWDCFQKLERCVGNDMVDMPLDTFKMSDELKRDSKGMDKWSFKQRGPKARKRKKG